MLQERSHPSRGKHGTHPLHLWWRISCIPILTLTLFALTLAVCVSGQTNEPVWPSPGASHLFLEHFWKGVSIMSWKTINRILGQAAIDPEFRQMLLKGSSGCS